MKEFEIQGLVDNGETEETKVIVVEDYEQAYDYAYNYFDKAVWSVKEVN